MASALIAASSCSHPGCHAPSPAVAGGQQQQQQPYFDGKKKKGGGSGQQSRTPNPPLGPWFCMTP